MILGSILRQFWSPFGFWYPSPSTLGSRSWSWEALDQKRIWFFKDSWTIMGSRRVLLELFSDSLRTTIVSFCKLFVNPLPKRLQDKFGTPELTKVKCFGRAWMCVYMCVCMYVCMCVCMNVYMYVCMRACVYVYVCMCVCIHACMHVCVHSCPSTCTCVHLCKHTFVHALFPRHIQDRRSSVQPNVDWQVWTWCTAPADCNSTATAAANTWASCSSAASSSWTSCAAPPSWWAASWASCAAPPSS